MKQYYSERSGLLTNKLSLSLDELKSYFLQTYNYYRGLGYFEIAENGIWIEDRWTHEKNCVVPRTMSPSPEVFFAVTMQDSQVWPVVEFGEYYDEATLFSVMEILYDHIARYDYQNEKIEKEVVQRDYLEHINNILKAYKTGYYLVPTTGFIMEEPNEALQQQLNYNGEGMPENVYEQLKSASQSYYRFDSDSETKKKAIASLADILENVRQEVKDLFNSEYQVPKNEHDKLIFEVVNGYNIRHDNQRQKTDYSKEIWYDWMMQYYTSVIIAFFRLKSSFEIDF